MSEIIFRCLFAALAIIGLIEVFRAILLAVTKKDTPGRLMLMLTLKGHDGQAEYHLRSAIIRAAWSGTGVQVVCIDRGMDEETRRVCEMLCVDHPEVILCTPEEFQNFWMK